MEFIQNKETLPDAQKSTQSITDGIELNEEQLETVAGGTSLDKYIVPSEINLALVNRVSKAKY
jgi:hypothetical protein